MSVDLVNAPTHYTSHASGVECIELARHMPFALGNALKYVWRAGLKDARIDILAQDLRKARWYLADASNHAHLLWVHFSLPTDVERAFTATIAAEPNEHRRAVVQLLWDAAKAIDERELKFLVDSAYEVVSEWLGELGEASA